MLICASNPESHFIPKASAASLGFSRAPIVETLSMLRAEGLVISRRRVGTSASEIGRDQIEEVFEVREMLEQRVVPVVVHNVSDRQIDALGNIFSKANKLLEASSTGALDYPRFMEFDAWFHSESIRLSEGVICQGWLDKLAAHMQRVRHLFAGNVLERSPEGQKKHNAILAAFRERDVDELSAKLLSHTRRSRIGAAKIPQQQ